MARIEAEGKEVRGQIEELLRQGREWYPVFGLGGELGEAVVLSGRGDYSPIDELENVTETCLSYGLWADLEKVIIGKLLCLTSLDNKEVIQEAFELTASLFYRGAGEETEGKIEKLMSLRVILEDQCDKEKVLDLAGLLSSYLPGRGFWAEPNLLQAYIGRKPASINVKIKDGSPVNLEASFWVKMEKEADKVKPIYTLSYPISLFPGLYTPSDSGDLILLDESLCLRSANDTELELLRLARNTEASWEEREKLEYEYRLPLPQLITRASIEKMLTTGEPPFGLVADLIDK
ncbi:hypothetical protein ISS42_00275 [Candidatus Shapirobacteria bacterium]|nr:hypothetical protein [Candidatus Shapirobacteria bacterium]